MNNPYITTYLESSVRILPKEMDNNIRKYIKTNIEKDHIGKCFQDYGFVSEVHEIEIISDGRIIPEDPMCCALFDIRFSATLCRPVNHTSLIAKIIGMSQKLIILSYGPLQIIIKTANSINNDMFTYNQNLSRWIVKKKNKDDKDDRDNKDDKKNVQKYIVLKNEMYVKVKILNKKIVDKTKQIICMGFMEDIATDKEIEQSIKDMYEPKKYSSIDEYINIEHEIQNALIANVKTDTDENETEEENDL
jgi:DNA-directed RNA polymerase subunit E'/Rpb7